MIIFLISFILEKSSDSLLCYYSFDGDSKQKYKNKEYNLDITTFS